MMFDFVKMHRLYVCMFVYMYVSMCAYVCMYVCTYVCVHVLTYISLARYDYQPSDTKLFMSIAHNHNIQTNCSNK